MNNEITLRESWDFWKKIVCNPDGSLNETQVRKELHDFYIAMQCVPKVYDHITGGTISKILTDPKHVIDAAEENYGELYL